MAVPVATGLILAIRLSWPLKLDLEEEKKQAYLNSKISKVVVYFTLTDGEDDCESFRKNPNPPFFGDGWLNHDEIIGENPFWGHGGGHVAVGGAICPTATQNPSFCCNSRTL